jgi:PAS domain S-box-containing protein
VTKRSHSASRRPARATRQTDLRARAEEAEEMLRAMQSGQVDAIVRFGPAGHKVFTLEGAEHVYRVMVESMGEGAVTLTSDGMIVYANLRFAEMVKKDLQDAIGTSMSQIIAPGNVDAFEALMREASTSAGACKCPMDLLQSDGKKLAVNLTLHGLDHEGSAHIVAVVTDLSEIKRAAAARDQLAHIVDSAIDAIVGKDLDGNITSWNNGAEQLYGYTAAEAVGRNTEFLAAPERKHEAQTFIANILRGETVDRYETVRITKAGKRLDVLAMLSPITDESGTIVGVSSMTHDITERKRLERMQDNFVSTVSHELRTPLTSISASMALLAGGVVGQVDGRSQGFIDIALRNAERLSRLVNDILDIEKLQAGKLEFHPVVLELEDHIGNAVDTIRPLASKQDIALVVDFGAQPHQVAADPDRLIQAITNILSNAIKFSPEGAEVLVRTEDRDHSVRVSIIDHGCGIPDDFRKRVFERFAQADDSSTRKQPGTGLGLNIAREIIERLGGKISFDSVVGSGTTFHIDLPTYHAPKQGPLATPRLDAGHAQTMSS